MVGAQDGGVTRQIVETVRDDGDNNVQHDEGAEEDEGDEVDVGHRRAAPLVRVRHVELAVLGVVPLVGHGVAGPPVHGGHHDVGPGLARGTAEQHDLGLENISKVVVPRDLCVRIIRDVPKHLHSNYGVYKEQHQHQHHYIWKSLKRK